jgi:hypothetical protein
MCSSNSDIEEPKNLSMHQNLRKNILLKKQRQLNPCSRLLQELTVVKMVKKRTTSLGMGVSWPCSQKPTTGPHPHHAPYFFKFHFNNILRTTYDTSMARDNSPFQISRLKFRMYLQFFLYVLHSNDFPVANIWWNANYEASYHVIFVVLLLISLL